MGFLKGKGSLMIFDRHANLKYMYGLRNFWCRGYYVDTVGRNKKIIRIGEICALTWEDILMDEQCLYIHQTMQRIQVKNGTEKRQK